MLEGRGIQQGAVVTEDWDSTYSSNRGAVSYLLYCGNTDLALSDFSVFLKSQKSRLHGEITNCVGYYLAQWSPVCGFFVIINDKSVKISAPYTKRGELTPENGPHVYVHLHTHK